MLRLEPRDQLEAVGDLLLRRAAVGRDRVQLRADLLLEAADALLEELVDVRADDREELHALEQRDALVLGLVQHAPAEVEVGELAVEVELGRVEAVGTMSPMPGAGGVRPDTSIARSDGRACAARSVDELQPVHAGDRFVRTRRSLGGHRYKV